MMTAMPPAERRRLPRIALVVPTVELGQYWQPVLDEFAARTDEVRLMTALAWRGTTAADLWPHGHVQVVGRKRRVGDDGSGSDYGGGVMALSPRIVPALLRARPDAVIVSGFSAWSGLVLAARPVGRWAVVLAWEGSSPSVDFRSSPRRLALRRRIAAAADAVITNSPRGRDYLVDVLGVDPDAVATAPYMVPHPPARPAAAGTGDGRLRLLCVGRGESRKGILQLLDALAALDEADRRRIHLELVGDGPLAEQVVAARTALGLEDVVDLVGWVPYEEIPGRMAAADLLCFPTLEDTWGMVALEAMAAGTPVLCSVHAGVHPHADPDLVIDPHDTWGTAAVLRRLVADPDDLARRGQAAAARMAAHTPTAAAERLLAAARRARVSRDADGRRARNGPRPADGARR